MPNEPERTLDPSAHLTSDPDRESYYVLYRDMYDGDHGAQLSDRQAAYLQVEKTVEFSANHCTTVVDAVAERLKVTGFKSDAVASTLWEWWGANRMDALQGVVHLSVVRDGDTFLMVSWDNELARPVFSHELAYNGAEGVRVVYSTEHRRKMEYATKVWKTVLIVDGEAVEGTRLNIYYPDALYKYVTTGDITGNADWEEYKSDEDSRWPIPWVSPKGEPLGIPIVHFRNRDQGMLRGQSELKSVVPLQRALNKAIIDLLAAADTTAFRIFWMLGGNPSSLELAPGHWVHSDKPPGGPDGAQFGYFAGEDLGPLISFSDAFVMEIARVSRTPITYFQLSGHRPAEGTLKQEEAGLVAKVNKCQTDFGNTWEDAMLIALRLSEAFGAGEGASLAEGEVLSCLWQEAETRNASDHLKALQLKADLGIPREVLWAEMSYSQEEIEAMKELADKEADEAIAKAQARMQIQARILGQQSAADTSTGETQSQQTTGDESGS